VFPLPEQPLMPHYSAVTAGSVKEEMLTQTTFVQRLKGSNNPQADRHCFTCNQLVGFLSRGDTGFTITRLFDLISMFCVSYFEKKHRYIS
jgi:hypothetical protein